MNQKNISMLIKVGVISQGEGKELEKIIKQTKELDAEVQKLDVDTKKYSKELEELNKKKNAAVEKSKDPARSPRQQAAQKGVATKADKQVKELTNKILEQNAALATNTKRMDENNASTEKGGSNFESLKKKAVAMGAAIRGNGKDMNYLTNKIKETEAFKKMEKDAAAALEKVATKAKTAKERVRILGEAVTNAKDKVSNFGKGSNSSLQGFERTVKRIVTTLLTLSALRVFQNIIKQGAEFEAAMIRVAATAKATNDQYKQLVTEVRKVARDTIFTATEVSGVSQILAQSGFTTREILNSLSPILQLTGATMGELGQTTELVISILRAFNLETENTIDVANILTEATLSSRANIERLSVAFRFGGPAAAAFNQSIETTTAVLSRFIDLGLSASIAGTTLRRGLIELGKGGANQIEVLSKINLSLMDINPNFNDFGKILEKLAKTTLNSTQAIKLFGARAGATIFALVKRVRLGGESITEFSDKLEKSIERNRVGSLFAKISESLVAQAKLSKSAFQDLGISIFNTFRPALADGLAILRNKFIELNAELVKNTGVGFSKTLQKLIPLLEAVADGFIGIISIIAGFLKFIAELTSKFEIISVVIKGLIYLMGLLILRNILFKNIIGQSIISLAKLTLHMIFAGEEATRLGLKQLVTIKITNVLNAALRFLGISYNAVGKSAIVAKLAVASFYAVATVGISLIIAYLPEIIRFFKKIGETFFGLKTKTDEATESQIEHGKAIEFGTKQLKRFSDQTRIQIENQTQLNALRAKGSLIIAGEGEESESLATFTPSITSIFPQKAEKGLEFSLKNINGLIEAAKKEYEKSESLTDVIKKHVVFNVFDVADMNASYEALGKNLEEKIKNISYVIDRNAKNALGEMKIDSKKLINTYFNDLSNAVDGSAGKENVAAILKPLKDAISKQKISFGGSNFEIDKMDFDNADVKKAFENFTISAGIDIEKIDDKQLRTLERAFTSIITKSEEVVNALDKSSKGVADIFENKWKKPIEALGKSRVAIAKLRDEMERLLKSGDIPKDSIKRKETQKELINLKEREKAIQEELKKIMNDVVEEYKDEGTAGKIIIKNTEQMIDRAMEYNSILGSVPDTLLKIAANIKEANAIEELAKANKEYEIKKQKDLNDLLLKKKTLLAEELRKYDSIIDATGSLSGNYNDIGNEIDKINDKMEIGQSLSAIDDTLVNLENQIKHEKNILNLNLKIKKIQKQNADALTAVDSNQENRIEKAQLEVQTAERNAEIAQASEQIELERTKITELNLNIASNRLSVAQEFNKELSKRIDLERGIEGREVSLSASSEISDLNAVLSLNEKTNNEIEGRLEYLNKIESKGANEAEIAKILGDKYKNINQYKEALIKLSDRNNIASEKEFDIIARKAIIEKQSEKLNALNLIGSGKLASALQKRLDFVNAVKNAELDIDNRRSEGKKIADKILIAKKDETAEGRKRLKGLEKEFNVSGELLESSKESLRIMTEFDNAGIFGKATIRMKNYVEALIVAADAHQELEDATKNLVNIFKDFGMDEFKKAIDEKFGLISDEEEKLEEDTLKINDDLAKNLLKAQSDYLDKLRQLQLDHLRKLADINSDFDRERRDVERDIYNERVERLMSLAALEQELKLQGLTDEEQRAELLTQVDQNLSSIRLGTIEERQLKLTELEEQIKALNTLENSLGMSQNMIDQGSLERLKQLKLETSAFFNDKQTGAVNAIEAERTREIEAEKQRYKDALDALNRDKLISDQALKDQATAAKEALSIEKNKDDTLKRLKADLTKEILVGIAKVIIATALKAAKDSFFKKKEAIEGVTAQTALTTSVVASNVVQKASNKARAISAVVGYQQTTAAAAASAVAGIPVVGPALAIAAYSETLALLAPSVAAAIALAKGGAVTDTKGGIITGGRGGIDDIHTTLPAGSYIVNKRSTDTHRDELARMMNQRVNSVRKASAGVPVAVTAGEFYVPPQVYSANKNRIDQINRDRTGASSQSIYSGGSVRGYQVGGYIPTNTSQGPSKSIVINNSVEFSGLNVLSGDSEDAISTIYESGLRSKIQNDLDNKALI